MLSWSCENFKDELTNALLEGLALEVFDGDALIHDFPQAVDFSG